MQTFKPTSIALLVFTLLLVLTNVLLFESVAFASERGIILWDIFIGSSSQVLFSRRYLRRLTVGAVFVIPDLRILLFIRHIAPFVVQKVWLPAAR